jgi:hypothetical protein
MGCFEHGRTPLSAYEEGLCATEIVNCEVPVFFFSRDVSGLTIRNSFNVQEFNR